MKTVTCMDCGKKYKTNTKLLDLSCPDCNGIRLGIFESEWQRPSEKGHYLGHFIESYLRDGWMPYSSKNKDKSITNWMYKRD